MTRRIWFSDSVARASFVSTASFRYIYARVVLISYDN
jgi:hypothetical protein